MAKKQKSAMSAAEKQLRSAVKKLQTQLATAEKSTEKWKSRAKDNKSVASGFRTELTALRRRLEKAEGSVTKWKDRAKKPVPAMAPAASAPAPTSATSAPAPVKANDPDDSWTVADLRAEARRRGVTGYSRKTKAELIHALRS
jgi:lysophospholipase